MKRRTRIQPYVSPELHQRIRVAAGSEGVTESAVIEAALREYFAEKKPDRELIARRLDIVSQALARLQSDVDIIADAFGRGRVPLDVEIGDGASSGCLVGVV